MTSQIFSKWNGQVFLGFWFLTNFLRDEMSDEKVRLIVNQLTEKYNQYILAHKKTQFGPRFVTKVADIRAEEVCIIMEHPKPQEGESAEIGRIDLSLVDQKVTILTEASTH